MFFFNGRWMERSIKHGVHYVWNFNEGKYFFFNVLNLSQNEQTQPGLVNSTELIGGFLSRLLETFTSCSSVVVD